MASISIVGDTHSTIDYAVHDGRIRFFEYQDQVLFDENEGIALPNWKDKLIELIKDQGLDEDDGRGYHAFIYPLKVEGLL